MREEIAEVLTIIEEMLEICDRMRGTDREALQLHIYTIYGMLGFLIEEEEEEEEQDDPMEF
jgi:hypothetical protein